MIAALPTGFAAMRYFVLHGIGIRPGRVRQECGPRHRSILQERKDTIVKSVQDAEDRLDEANRRLSEAQKQLSQAHVVISEIRNETRSAKTNLLKSDANVAKKELVTRFNRAIAAFRSKERVIFLEVKQQIISLVLKRSAAQAKETFGSKKRARALINETIQKLEGDLL